MTDENETSARSTGPRQLDAMSIEELTDYISFLETEINRARLMIRQKKVGRDSAAAMFRKQF